MDVTWIIHTQLHINFYFPFEREINAMSGTCLINGTLKENNLNSGLKHDVPEGISELHLNPL
jgi:hypothetical protein